MSTLLWRFARPSLDAIDAAGPIEAAGPIKVVAAENFYGDIARQIGGAEVAVTSILSNPDQDPHEFEASPSTARAFADGALVIYNGAGYDPWAVKLLSASPSPHRARSSSSPRSSTRKPATTRISGTTPPRCRRLAEALAAKFAKLDPAHQADYAPAPGDIPSSRCSRSPSGSPSCARKYAGTPVTATEPVFGYMAAALGLDMRNPRFQLAVMNDTEPSAADIAAFEQDLRSQAVKILLYNSQTSEALTRRMRKIATQSGVPVVGVSETEPRGKDYQEWMLSQLDALDRALAR